MVVGVEGKLPERMRGCRPYRPLRSFLRLHLCCSLSAPPPLPEIYSLTFYPRPHPCTCLRNSQALEAELSGEYGGALKMYKMLLERYDDRYENDSDSEKSSRRMEEEGKEQGGEGG